jgi:restriction alleviation protein, Lar family
MDKPELKPCPFCGGKAILTGIEANYFATRCFVICDNCHASSKRCKNKEAAAEAWNRRADNQLSVGDKVYQTNGFNTYESTVKHVLYDTEKITFDSEAIGQSVFLTREEAEKRTMHLALEEAENHDEKS